MPASRPHLTVKQILAWADAHHARTGRWPSVRSGPVPESPGEKWQNIDQALYLGLRGLPRGDRLARLLARHRQGVGSSPHRAQPWTPPEEELVRTLPPVQAAQRTGRSLRAVYARRHVLGIGSARHWTLEKDQLVRALPPAEVARRTGHTLAAVYERRHLLGICLGGRQRV
jgi:hypothetical protein